MNSTVIGGSAVTVAMIKEFDQVHGVTVLQGWGMTEMSPLGTTNFQLQKWRKCLMMKSMQFKLKQVNLFLV